MPSLRNHLKSLFHKCKAATSSDEKYGLFTLHQPENPEASVDIIAVHGLGGHYEHTWTWTPEQPSSGEQCNWLRDLLPAQVPHARIMSFGYNSAVASSKSIGDISTFGEQLLTRVLLAMDHQQQNRHQIIFICHSLGGIVVKKMLMYANQRQCKRPECEELLHNIKGILFMGTPHRGSAIASLGSIGANMLEAATLGTCTNTTLLRQLKQGSDILQEISHAFAFLGSDMRIYTFIESARMDWLSRVIVDEDSARLNIPNEDVIPIDGNHRTMCKFRGETQNYNIVANIIKRLANPRKQQSTPGYISTLQSPTIHSLKRPTQCGYCSILPALTAASSLSPSISPSPVQKQSASRYLSALTYLSIPLLKREVGGETYTQRQEFDWFFESPEFTRWYSHNFEILSVVDRTDSTATDLLSCLWNSLSRDQGSNESEDVVVYVPHTHPIHQVWQMEVVRLLSTLISQLLHSNQERLDLVDLASILKTPAIPTSWKPDDFSWRPNKCSRPKYTPSHPSNSSRPEHSSWSLDESLRYLSWCPNDSTWDPDELWKLLSVSVTAMPSRQVTILIDAVHTFSTEARRTILEKVLYLQEEVRLQGVKGFKIFFTWKPQIDIQQKLQGTPKVEVGEVKRCLQSLKFDEFSARKDRVEEAHLDTGKWLADDGGYLQWDNGNSSDLLLIRGKPGSGKSTLAKTILNSTRSKYGLTSHNLDQASMEKRKDILIADFFYSSRGGEKETSHRLMLQSLLYQLLGQDERLYPLFRPVYRDGGNYEKGWAYKDLKRVFESLVSLDSGQKVYIFLDAMDESSELGRPEILRLLLNLCSSSSKCIFKCLVATRPLPARDIDERKDYCHVIILQDKTHGDIDKVVTARIDDIQNQPPVLSIDFKFAHEYITQHAQGVFLWVTLVLEELADLVSTGPNQKELDERLRSLPLELEGMYKLIVCKLVDKPKPLLPNAISIAHQMFSWVTFAEKPLSTKEFIDAIAIPPSTEPFRPDPRFLVMNRVTSIEDRIRTCCGPLVEISKPVIQSDGTSSQAVVQLLHLTAREFLLGGSGVAQPFHTDMKGGNEDIVASSIRYIELLLASLKAIEKRVQNWDWHDYDKFVDWLAGFSLLEYITAFLPKHMIVLTQDARNAQRMQLLPALDKNEVMYCLFEEWLQRIGNVRIGVWDSKAYARQFRINCLVASARGSYMDVINPIIELGTDVNGRDEGKSEFPLLVAAREGHLEMVRKLLAKGANPSMVDNKHGRNVESIAQEGKHYDVVDVLRKARHKMFEEDDES